MISSIAYVAINESTGGCYDGKLLTETVNAIARPIDFKAYGLPEPNLPELGFFEFGTSTPLMDIIIVQEANSTLAIGSKNRNLRLTKAMLETHAKNLRLEAVA